MIYLVGVLLDFAGVSYYQTSKDVTLNDFVVVSTDHGTFVCPIKKIKVASEEEVKRANFNKLYEPILRIATFSDRAFYEESQDKEKEILKEAQDEANTLKLDMKMLSAHLDCDDDKVLITFTADQRVDFRELVRILSGMFRLRIELRQIGPRDHARIVGGIGPCGLPLCCSTFLKTFDGISISMAKNQLLSINIPKLSGQCGKLMCCLKYEDDAYSKIRPLYPKIGEKITYHNSEYSVTGLNLLSDTITTYNGDNYETFTREEYEKVKKGLLKDKPVKMDFDINAGIDLSGHGLKDTNRRIEEINRKEERHQEELQKQNRKNKRGKKNRRGNNNAAPQKNQGQNAARSNNPNRNRNNNNNNRNQRNNPRNNNRNHNRSNRPYNRHNNVKKESGFVPVSSFADKSVLDVKPVRNDHEKK